MEQKLGLIVGIFGAVCGLSLMVYAFIKIEIYRKNGKSNNKQGDKSRFCSIEKGGCKK